MDTDIGDGTGGIESPAGDAVARLKRIPEAVKEILNKARTEPKARVQLAFIALGVALVLGGGIYGIVYAAEHGTSTPPPAADNNNHQPDPSTAASTAGGTSLSGSPLALSPVTFAAGPLSNDAGVWTWLSRHNQLPPTDPAYIDPRKWVWDKASSKWYSQGGASYVVLKYAGSDTAEFAAVQQRAATAFVG